MSVKEKLSKLSKYISALIFLALEVVAFISFSFGGSFLLLAILSFVLCILLVLFSIREINVDGVSNLALLIFPLLLFTLLTALGVYSRQMAYLSIFSYGDLIFIPIGLLSVVICGYLLSLHKEFKMKHFFIVVYSALAVLVFLNLLVTLINFGPFHTIIYKGYYMYFAGKRSTVPAQDMAYTLYGFKFIEAEISRYYMYPALLLTSHFLLIKTSFKEEKRYFITYLGFAVLGLLASIFVPSWLGFVIIGAEAIITGITFLVIKAEKSRKPLKIALMIFLGLGAIAYFIFILNSNSTGLANVIKGNRLLNRLFNSNRFVNPMNPILEGIFTKGKFYGYAGTVIGDSIILVNLSGSYLVDGFATSGVIGMMAFIGLLIAALVKFKKFFLNSDEPLRDKVTLLLFPLIFFGYSLLFNDPEFGIFYEVREPIYMSGPFMLSLLIFGYIASKGGSKKEVVTDEK